MSSLGLFRQKSAGEERERRQRAAEIRKYKAYPAKKSDTVYGWMALFPHSNTILVSDPGRTEGLLCGVCMFDSCLGGSVSPLGASLCVL